MYRAAASGIRAAASGIRCRGSKLGEVRASFVASRSASSIGSCGVNDTRGERDRVSTPLMTGPSQKIITTPPGGKSSGPAQGPSSTREIIDLEARGFAILREHSGKSSLANYSNTKSAINEDMRHQISTSGKSFGKMSHNSVFQRGFSSQEEKIPVISNLIYHDDYHRRADKLESLSECLTEEAIVKTIWPEGLLRKVDLLKFGNLALGNLGFHLLRQLAALATLNLMRGLNICELIQLENLLWSPRHKGIVLNNTTLSVDTEPKGCPYAAGKKVFEECLEISTGKKEVKVKLPKEVNHYLLILDSASEIDKRRINNHSAILFPGERIQRKSRINQLLRQDLPLDILAVTKGDLADMNSSADTMFLLLSEVFPKELLTSYGLHPAIDCWVREGQKLRGVKASNSPVRVLINEDLTLPVTSGIELGKILVALNRDPFEHLYQPLFLKKWLASYTALDVEKLLNTVNPMYVPVADYYFMIGGFWPLLEVDPGRKAPYFYWTNISEEPPRRK